MSWTDRNEHDPGITLVELFAFLAEALAYLSDEVAAGRKRTLWRYAAGLIAVGALVFVCRRRTAAPRLPG